MSSEITSLITFIESNFTGFSSMPGVSAAFILLIAFVVLSILEFSFPKRRLPAKQLRQSYQTNAGLFIFNSLIISATLAPLLMVADRYSDRGLLSYVEGPAWKALLSFLLLDLLLYCWHKLSHSFDSLWMFHKVHHNDPYLNVSTAFRLHIVELLIITVLKSSYIVLLGVDKTMVLTNEILLTLFIMFHHSNIAFSGEKRLGLVIIVPYLHRAHHSTERNEHDTNYGAVFSIWDRLFGTFIERKLAKIGIKNSSPQTVLGLVKFGFTPANPAPVPTCQPDLNLNAMIAEAAYYKAEKRAFTPGNELRDWLEAKREINRIVYGDRPGKRSQPVKSYALAVSPISIIRNGKYHEIIERFCCSAYYPLCRRC
ncbi:sterol desaturase family protein [Methylobacter sp.]|uniref:sterol desaturase family protein n=1 Tax=Methylobacter sp. TaxID=2051955 RepID=UPI0024870A4A|nr:sterol desaturase family protein [Methylobacter sp.]MDI1278880.1 sterol desaturase family protein [Methylobacter sp.]MDI1359717.1 sterol desaturase family protein [Methylobacter sp.]